MERINYINNRELLAEIDRCKQSYTAFLLPQHQRFDAIVHDIAHLTPDFLQATLLRRIEIVTKQGVAVWGTALADGILIEHLVFRVMTKEHIPTDPSRKRRLKIPSDEGQTRTPFPPYKHYVVRDGGFVEVVRSHWQGDFETGHFALLQGQISRRLAMMFMLLVERYSKRGNWRGYCCDQNTEALTQRGWLGIDEINETDIILSYDQGQLKWSKIKSIFRDDYDGKMFHLTVTGMDALVTPHHKFITQDGLKEVELLVERDRVILTENAWVTAADIDFHGGKRTDGPNEPTIDYQGKVWCPETEFGSFMARRNGCEYLSGNTYIDEMRSQALLQLSQIGLQFDESRSDNPFAFYTTIIKHCLAGDTMILTREFGSIPIGDVSEQDVTLLDGNGDWVKCHIYDHGVQATVNLNLFGGFEKVSIRSTMEHGWVENQTNEIKYTKDFVNNNNKGSRSTAPRIADLRPSKTIKNEVDYRRGVVHGLIYGDGSARSDRPNDCFIIRLCAEKIALEPWLQDHSKTYQPCANGEPTFHLSRVWADLKALPVNPGASLDYLLGFLRGWFATDGCVSVVPTPTLCGDEAEYNWVKQWGPLVGWHLNGYTKLNEITNYGRRNKISLNFHLKKNSMDAEDFLREKHHTRWQKYQHRDRAWRVYPGKSQDFSEVTQERVYCPVVETTHTFALSCGIHLLNCFTRVLNVERKHQRTRDDLLIIAGVQPSYTRQIDHEIEQRFGDEHGTTSGMAASKVVELPKKRGRKPKSDRPAETETDPA